jgi:integral membrane protein
MQMLKTRIGRLRAVGLAEGTSYLLLLGVAMPLKYIAGVPLAVKIAGWIHGLLFMLFSLLLLDVMTTLRWPFKRALGVFVASLLPFGNFAIDGWLKRQPETPSDPDERPLSHPAED